MVEIPGGFSTQAVEIRAALSEGRTDDARSRIVEILLSGKADKHVQRLAAEMIKPPPKSRGRQKAQARHWFPIGMEFASLRSEGVSYEDALRLTADKFGYSETHCRKAIGEYEESKAASDDAARA